METLSNGKVCRSESEWQEIMSRFLGSGLTRERFCREQGLSQTSFSKWSKRLQVRGKSSDVGQFVEIGRAEVSDNIRVELSFASGMILRIGG